MSTQTATNRVTSILLFIVVAIIAANTYLATVPEVPRWVVVIFGLGSVVATIAREQLKPQIVVQAQTKP